MVAIRNTLRAALLPTLLVTFMSGSSHTFALAPDPAVVAEVEAQEQFRKDLRREVLRQKGIDPIRWGEDVANPFTNLTDEGKTKLKALGVDVERLAKLPAVLLVGNYCGASSQRFVNHNPDAIIILGKGFITHDYVYSLGPILAVEDAHIMGGVVGADLVWFVEKSCRCETKGALFLAGPETQSRDSRPPQFPWNGDYGWRRPDDFLKPREVQPGAKLPPLAVDKVEQKRRDLFAQVTGRQRATDTADWCESVVNPFSSLSVEGKAKLWARGIDPDRLSRLKAVLLTGSDAGADSHDFVNRDPNTILVIGKDFCTQGSVFSAGPVLAAENAHFMGNLTGADLVWCVEQSSPRGVTTGLPVILAPSSRSQMSRGSEDVWYGDYGWRRPTNFLKPAPVKLTGQELEALWAALPENDPKKSARMVRRLIAGAEQSVPYLKQRLRLEAAPPPEEVARLLADLDSDSFQKREAATGKLEKVGLHVTPALEKLLQNPPSLEARRRAEQVLQLTQDERQRAKLALSALEQIDSPEALALLEEWAKGEANFFLTREAQAALQRLRGLSKP